MSLTERAFSGTPSRFGASRVLLVCTLLWSPAPALASDVTLDPSQWAALVDSPMIGAGLLEALAAQTPVRILISFEARGATPTERQEVTDRLVERVDRHHGELIHRFRHLNALAVSTDAAGVAALLEMSEITGFDLDLGGEGHLLESVPLTGLDFMRRKGKKGRRRTVAILDSGIDKTHPDLRRRVKEEACFCSGEGGCCPDGSSRQIGSGSAEDDQGHGTSVAGILASRGRQAPKAAAFKAKIVSVKVLDQFNRFCCSSDILAALDWLIDEHPEVDVVNMSLGTSALFRGKCDRKAGSTGLAFAEAIGMLRERGALVFASSGNQASPKKMTMPACIAETMAVAAIYDSEFGAVSWGDCSDSAADPNHVTCFSNVSSQTDLAAPGVVLTTPRRGGGARDFVGTSAASPMAAACATLLMNAFPEATPDEIEAAMENSGRIATHTRSGRGIPSLDCEAAWFNLTQ